MGKIFFAVEKILPIIYNRYKMIEVIKYQIRASNLQPKGSGCPTGTPTQYFYQTFGGQKIIVDVYDAKTTLLKSSDMQGLKPGNEESPTYRASTYTKASYSGKGMRTSDGSLVFSANEEHVPEFVEESEVPGWE